MKITFNSAKKRIIAPEEVICTIRAMFPDATSSFHLSRCYCGMPTWKQPCQFCGYYPDWSYPSYTGTGVKRNEYGTIDHCKSFFTEEKTILFYVFQGIANCCCPFTKEKAAYLYNQVKDLYQWPDAQSMYDNFGMGATKERVDELNLITVERWIDIHIQKFQCEIDHCTEMLKMMRSSDTYTMYDKQQRKHVVYRNHDYDRRLKSAKEDIAKEYEHLQKMREGTHHFLKKGMLL